jgi:voltage-gated sodium channel
MNNYQSDTKITLSRLKQLVDSQSFMQVITALILINAIILGMETYPRIMHSYGHILKTADQIILFIFVGELLLRFIASSRTFFRSPWNIFDFIIVSIAFIPTNEVFAVLRAVRVVRALRLVSIFPRLRRVVEGLIRSLPGIGSIGAILLIIMYVFAVMATKLYSASFPQWFGSLESSVFSLFQIMTLEGWPDIVRSVMKTYPHAWIFFVIYILIATFSVLNLFIAVIVDAMQKQHEAEEQENDGALTRIEIEISKLSRKIDQLTQGEK